MGAIADFRMSERSDIIDGKDAPIARRGLVYTCRCGWLDLGHARPDNAKKLWRNLNHPAVRSADGVWFKVTFHLSVKGYDVIGGDFAVRSGLGRGELEGVGLGILLRVSHWFESTQNILPDFISDSGYSVEDMISNLVSYYRAVKGDEDYVAECQPVSKATAEKIWDTFGAVGSHKNKTLRPYLFPCKECGLSSDGGQSGELPVFLAKIQPATEGKLFRKWRLTDEIPQPRFFQFRRPGPQGSW